MTHVPDISSGFIKNETIETPVPPQWHLLDRMELRERAERQPDGTVRLRRWALPGLFLYGPHLRLAQGRYRLTFRCAPGRIRQPEWPVLGVEAIAQNRFLRGWADFTAAELAAGEGALVFDVPPDLDSTLGTDAPFEFRFVHFCNADLTISAITLERLGVGGSGAGPAADIAMTWRLRGWMLPPLERLAWPARRFFLELHHPAQAIVPRLSPLARMRWGCLPHLRLPAGRYRLDIHTSPERGAKSGAKAGARRKGDALRVRVTTQRRAVVADQLVEADGQAPGLGSLTFAVPDAFGLEGIGDVRFTCHFSVARGARRRLLAADLHFLGPADPSLPMPAIADARRSIVVVGNCQAGLVAQGFQLNDVLARRFNARHHFMELPANLHEQGRRELAACDVVLAQDIRDWETYPLRAEVPDGVPIVKFPCLGFASLWPFDAFNGPDDREARWRDFPNYEFTYFDGLLARLRKEIPDPEARFAAYRALEIEGIVDCRRLHRFEERRLTAMDRKFGGGIGAFILDTFRTRQVFHTTGHPSGEVLTMLLQQLAGQLGVGQRIRHSASMNELARLEIPVHPKVAAMLGVRWIDENSLFRYRGERISWETYVRRYIAYYG